MASVSIRNIQKSYAGSHVIRDLSLEIPDRAFVVLVGPSGCGKSTVLRMIAGLEEISGGELDIGGRIANDLDPAKRDIAMVFQNYALYPHMTVYENIEFGLKQRKTPKAERRQRIAEVAHTLDIAHLMERRPRELSGGQRQRVAMARAMVRRPSVFLFDEPLSNLDAKLRMHMRTEIKRIHQQAPTTTIYVTHDQVEAMTLADTVVVMNHGLIEQIASPQELYRRPRTVFVAGFVGSPTMNFFECTLRANQDWVTVETADGNTPPLRLPIEIAKKSADDRPALLGIRPEHLSIASSAESEASLTILCEVVESLGPEALAYWTMHGKRFCARIPGDCSIKHGDLLRLVPDMKNSHLFDQDTGERLN